MYRRVQVGEELSLGMPAPAVELFEVRDRPRAPGRLARHQRTPQLLAAMDGRRWGLWLSPAGPAPTVLTWVEAEATEAILLDAGTWHYGPVPLEADRGTYLTVEAPGTNLLDFEDAEAGAVDKNAKTPPGQ